MKSSNLSQFNSFEIPKEFLKFLTGGSCTDLLKCHQTADRDYTGQPVGKVLHDACDRILGSSCN
jgi:hypothetical protein